MLQAGPTLPSIADTIFIREWIVCGPFPVGTREGITGVVEDPATFRPAQGDTFRSSLVQGGVTVCRKVPVDSTGWLESDYQDVRWDSIQDYYGNVGLACAGYAYAEFRCSTACRALALTPKLGGFFLNGKSYLGDVYGNGWFKVPVKLDSGLNRVLLRLSGFGDQRVQFKLVPAPTAVLIPAEDVTLPDLVADSAFSGWLGIPLVNTTNERISRLNLKVSLLSGKALADTTIRNLPALGAKKVAVRVAIEPRNADSAGLALVIRVAPVDTSPGVTQPEEPCDTVRLRIRKPEQERKVTFVSAIDSSCQYYAVLYPRDYDPARRYALILSVHGAGVEASGQVDAYKPKDWAFVVAPTNRRPFGFDWQDWGRLDANEVLDQALRSCPVDRDRVLLTGHSMGGHGTWHVGLAHSDRFAAAAPEAGWPSHQLYVPWFLQRSAVFAEPALLAIRDQALRPDNAPAMLVNALNLPLFILHGGDDDNVPTIHGRNFAEWLKELGYRFTYKEVPGRKHWWNYESLNVSVLDDTSLMAFLKEQHRDPGPRHIRLRTADLGQSNHDYWATIERVPVVGRDAEIEAWAGDSFVRVKTVNVEQFSLELLGQPFFSGSVVVEIDGSRVGKRAPLPARLTFHRDNRGWAVGPARAGALAKTPSLYGPAKQAMMSPFVIVYGTRDPGLVDFLRHSATQEAVRWWLIGNGSAEVLPDTEVTDSITRRDNLVLLGGPAENSVTRRVHDALPVQVRRGRMYLGRHELGDSLAALVVFPSPMNPKRLAFVRMGTDPENVRLSLFWGWTASSAGIPDFMVFDKTVRRYGWAGVRAAGFFDADWNVAPTSTYIRE